MIPMRKYEYVIIRNDKEIGINEYGFDYLINLEKVLDEIREVIIELRNIIYNPDYENFGLSREQYKDRFIHIFEILDKVDKE